MNARFGSFLTVVAAVAVSWLGVTNVAEACGCFSPPVPPPDSSNYAVNQQSEQIIFEVNEEDGTVTAHVMILYQGDPEQFGWLLPAPNVPELGLSEAFAFAVVDELTRPIVRPGTTDACPQPEYTCEYRTSCPSMRDFFDDSPSPAGENLDAAAGDGGLAGPMDPPVTILARETVGDYETIVFEAGDTALAVDWLVGEGFIVNETTAPFMQPYADAGMVFVAAKLVAGADVESIKPLKMTYQGTTPMIPLRITAVAAEPELTVTAFIYADQPYGPRGRDLVQLDPESLSDDGTGRVNYPMALSRAIDEAGGDGFVVEYAGIPPVFNDAGGCCGGGFDSCGLGGNGACECPRDDFDAIDCEQQAPGFALTEELATRHSYMTRVTTRLSPNEMDFDPMYEPQPWIADSRISLQALRTTLDGCAENIATDEGRARRDELAQLQLCASTYCGQGECVVTDGGAGCACNGGFVARAFTDLDGARSVTCVPEEHPVDLAAGGLEIRSSCEDVDCGAGTCVDLAGFPSCQCDAGFGAVIGTPAPTCLAINVRSGDPGALGDYSRGLNDVDVCWAMPRDCGDEGWLVRAPDYGTRRGVACGWNEPSAAAQRPLPAHECGRTGVFAGGGDCSAAGSTGGGLILMLGAALLWMRRR